jgi:hypothetical protein
MNRAAPDYIAAAELEALMRQAHEERAAYLASGMRELARKIRTVASGRTAATLPQRQAAAC